MLDRGCRSFFSFLFFNFWSKKKIIVIINKRERGEASWGEFEDGSKIKSNNKNKLNVWDLVVCVWLFSGLGEQ